MRILSSPINTSATSAFRWQALLAVVAQLLVNICFFLLLTLLLIEQSSTLEAMNQLGLSSVSAQDALVQMQYMNAIYTNRSVPGLIDHSRLDEYATNLYRSLDHTWQQHHSAYLGEGSKSADQQPTDYSLRTLWEAYIHPEARFFEGGILVNASTSLWRLGNTWLRHGFELHHRHAELGTRSGSLEGTLEFNYMHVNGRVELYTGYSNVLDALLFKSVDSSHDLNLLQLVLLIMEGCCICSLIVAYMAWLLRKVDAQRYGVYSVFLIVPNGLIRAQASMAIQVDTGADQDQEEADEPIDDMLAAASNANRRNTEGDRGDSSHVINMGGQPGKAGKGRAGGGLFNVSL